MRKSAYMIAAVMIASGIMIDNNIVNANEAIDGSMVNITATIDKYVEETNGNTDTVDENNTYIGETQNKETNIYVERYAGVNISKYPRFENVLLPKAELYLNVRLEADEESEVVGKLYVGSAATIVEEGEEWTKIESGNVIGYVKNEFTMRNDEAGEYAEANLPKEAEVTTELLFVREEQSVESDCIGLASEGNTYKVIELSEEWIKIETDDNTIGYVSAEYVDVDFQLADAISKEEEELIKKAEEEKIAREKKEAEEKSNSKKTDKTKTSNNENVSNNENASSNNNSTNSQPTVSIGESGGSGRSDIVEYALQFVGNPYVYGGTSLTNGTDCSGFVMSVYANFGYSLPRTSADQSNVGSEVSLDSLQPGDLLFYRGSNGRISHVTMYMGNGQVVHASTERTGITISSVNYRTPCCARRVAN